MKISLSANVFEKISVSGLTAFPGAQLAKNDILNGEFIFCGPHEKFFAKIGWLAQKLLES
jgi:hypothetical protein